MPPPVRALTTSFDYPRRVLLRTALAAIALALALAAPAAAAEISLSVAPEEGVRLGSATKLSGKVTENGAPLAGLTVALELRRHPYKGEWRRDGDHGCDRCGRRASRSRASSTATTSARVRLVDVAPPVYSPPREAYVLPAFTLTFDERSRAPAALPPGLHGPAATSS